MKTSIRPLHDRIVVRRLPAETRTASGLYIPDNAKEKPAEGEVLAVGSGLIYSDGSTRPMDVKVGDRIIFGKYAGNEIKVDGEEQTIVREDDVMGVVEKT